MTAINRHPATVSEVLAKLTTARSNTEIVDALEAGTEAIVGADLVHRLVPFAVRFQAIDFSGRPWAGLPAGVAICAVDRAAGRQVLTAARLEFEASGEETGLGWACFLEGLEDLGEGQLARAEEWWERARLLLGPAASVSQFSALHQALAAYGRGELKKAARIAEQALNAARMRSDHRLVAIAGVYLALFRWWMGDFRGVEGAGSTAAEAIAHIEDPLDRYEEPLVEVVFGTVHLLRGEDAAGEERMNAALELSAALQNAWYDAIVRSIRAILTSHRDPRRGLADARRALDYFEPIDEEWWSHWALEAYVIAQRENGDHYASVVAGRRLLERVENPLERGRAMLELAISLTCLDEVAEAQELLFETIEILTTADARFLVARAELQLAQVNRRRAAYLVRSARARAGTHVDDPAWRRLLRGPAISLKLLGTPVVEVDRRRVDFATSHETEAIAALAIAGPNGMSAERLRDMLWPAATRAQTAHRLDVLLSNVRQRLLPATRIVREASVVRLDLDDGECDVLTADAMCRRLLAGDDVSVTDARAALRHAFLAGSTAEWVVEYQMHLDALLARTEARLAESGTRSP